MARRTVAEYGPHPIDVHVGSRVRVLRGLNGMNQTQLGEALGLTFQQIQKNEKGVNRIGASRLYQLSRILGVSVEYFFEGLDEGLPTWSPDDILPERETLKLVRAYYRIRDPKVRKAVSDMAKAMAEFHSA